MEFKEDIRVLAIDDSPFELSNGSTWLIGCVYRGNHVLESVLREDIEVDGQDATETIISLVEGSDQSDHLKAVLLDGITFGGFNTADIQEINRRVDKPVIAINRERPDFQAIEDAAESQEQTEHILDAVENAGEIFEAELEPGNSYFQCAGADPGKAREIIEKSTYKSGIPEALRVSHIIATGITKGKSTGGR